LRHAVNTRSGIIAYYPHGVFDAAAYEILKVIEEVIVNWCELVAEIAGEIEDAKELEGFGTRIHALITSAVKQQVESLPRKFHWLNYTSWCKSHLRCKSEELSMSEPEDFSKYVAQLEERIRKLEGQHPGPAQEPIFGTAQGHGAQSTEVNLGWQPSRVFVYTPNTIRVDVSLRAIGFTAGSIDGIGGVFLYVAWR
jgi:hypothetical protein